MGKVKKIIYSTSYIATYLFETTNYDGTFTRWNTQVEVLGETDKSYLIKLKEPIRQHFAGDQIWVLKRKVRFPKAPVDPTKYWFNNFESKELPQQNS